jgi:putative hydrolase of the HAD superfamily
MIVVLDIGGVLLKLGGMQTFLAWTGLSPDILKSRWIASPTVIGFETGRIVYGEFARAVIEEFGLPVTPAELKHQMQSWMGDMLDGAQELLDDLGRRHQLAFLCNVNEVIWPVVRTSLQPERWSDHIFLSHELGVAKPDPQIYQSVTHSLGADPGDIHFFDDTRENVMAAGAFGWRAHLVDGPSSLREAARQVGLL